MATLPVMGYVVGGALSTGLVAKSQAKWGRRVSFQLGLLVGLLSAVLCAYAAYAHNFALLTAATLIAGYYSANGQLYRFAAAELAEVSFREKAVSWVMAGGLIGAIVGPNLASKSKGWFETPFMGAYVALTVVAVLGMVLMHFVKFPPVVEKPKGSSDGRPLSEIMKQPVFIVAAVSAAMSYGVMNLLMAATPLAMQVHTEQVQETWKSAVPMHRYGTPREVAQAICFLLDSEKTAYMTGQIISVDGGFVNTGLLA